MSGVTEAFMKSIKKVLNAAVGDQWVANHDVWGSAASQSNTQETIQMMEVNFVRMISYPAELCLRCHRDHLRKESGTDTAMCKGGIPRKGTSFWFKTAMLFKVIGGSASLLNPIPATTTKFDRSLYHTRTVSGQHCEVHKCRKSSSQARSAFSSWWWWLNAEVTDLQLFSCAECFTPFTLGVNWNWIKLQVTWLGLSCAAMFTWKLYIFLKHVNLNAIESSLWARINFVYHGFSC